MFPIYCYGLSAWNMVGTQQILALCWFIYLSSSCFLKKIVWFALILKVCYPLCLLHLPCGIQAWLRHPPWTEALRACTQLTMPSLLLHHNHQ